jgi:hypothetical protein
MSSTLTFKSSLIGFDEAPNVFADFSFHYIHSGKEKQNELSVIDRLHAVAFDLRRDRQYNDANKLEKYIMQSCKS